MSLLLKDPGAALDYSVDWGSEYLSDESLSASAWEVVPDEPGGIAVVEHDFDELVATVTVDGGEPGKIYRLTNNVTTGSGRSDRRSITLRVEVR